MKLEFLEQGSIIMQCGKYAHEYTGDVKIAVRDVCLILLHSKNPVADCWSGNEYRYGLRVRHRPNSVVMNQETLFNFIVSSKQVVFALNESLVELIKSNSLAENFLRCLFIYLNSYEEKKL